MAVGLALGGAASVAWWHLQRHETAHYAEILEAESYATRSDLVKELEVQLTALREVADYWNDYAQLSPDQWHTDARIELSHFDGIETILWSDPAHDIRYATSVADGLRLNVRPSDTQWKSLAPLLANVDPARGERLLGPVRHDDGHMWYRVQVPAHGPGASGVLVASVDADEQLAGLLADRSPGYAIRVSWGDDLLYQRGQPATNVPDQWVRTGLIELSMGARWRVTHIPEANLAASLSRPAVPGLLVAGWLIAVLVAVLIHQMGRVRERARAAELAEQRNQALNAELEVKVAQRTEELAERNSDLETLNQSVSHDIRDPMNAITLNTHLLERTLSGGGPGDAVRHIVNSLQQMRSVVDRLDAYSTATFIEFVREPVDMEAVVERVRGQMDDADIPGGLRLDVGKLPACRAQPMLVEILWHNLIGNAVKYSRDRPQPHIEIGADDQAVPVTYWIRDNGIGFDPREAEAIFRPFARLSHAVQGQGLGLAIVARVVKRHGGTIRAESTPGSGARFWFHLGEESGALDLVRDEADSPSVGAALIQN